MFCMNNTQGRGVHGEGSERGGEWVTTLSSQITGQRADSVHPQRDFAPFSSFNPKSISWRALWQERSRGMLGDGCEIRSARTQHSTNCIKQGNLKRAQGFCPWSPSQEGARDQSASARRGLPSKGEARALHHQPRPSIDLDHALLRALPFH
jgi:hypothetical protein